MNPSPLQLLLFAAVTFVTVPKYCHALWPKAEAVTKGSKLLCVKNHLHWRAVGYTSDILTSGFERYAHILRSTPLGVGEDDDVIRAEQLLGMEQHASNDTAGLTRRHSKRCRVVRSVEVSVTSSDQSLTMETRESYSLAIESHRGVDNRGAKVLIQANSVYGALRAMETLAQLVHRRSVGSLEGALGEGFVPDDDEEDMLSWPGTAVDPVSGAASSLDRRHATVLLVSEVSIYDAPRFRYRGLLIDTARHFLPVSVIKDHLDAMSMVKMNCLHWHLTDDQSFPWASEDLPLLAEKGAFAPEAVYTSTDIREVVEYARYRGIRVIPELDSPGHTQSWGRSYPEVLTECYDSATGQLAASQSGPLNPARNETFGFVWQLLRDLARLFPDPYVHLGGDEVDYECWKSNPEVQDFMRQKGFGSDFAKLQGYYMEQVVRLAAMAGKAPVVWQEAFDKGVAQLPPSTRVQIWKWWRDEEQATADVAADLSSSAADRSVTRGAGPSGAGVASARRRMLQEQQLAAGMQCDPGVRCQDPVRGEDDAWKAEMQAVTSRGYDVILSAPWYLNLGGYAGDDWKRYWSVDPTAGLDQPEQKDHVLGGTACAWGEYIDAVNAINRVWPRAAAVAERLWSHPDDDVDGAGVRLAELRCRMLSRGIAAQSLGPGFCPGELTTRM